jgi:uncharacterized Zn-binding protein involved in type VI secretion
MIVGPGDPTVLVGGPLAARVGDLAACASPAPNSIALGSFTVVFSRQPAARMSDPTAHGGVIAAGCLTVHVGDSGPNIAGLPVVRNDDGSYQVGRNIRIRSYDAADAARVLADLAHMAALPAGRAMLLRRDASGRTLTIIPRLFVLGLVPNAGARPANWADATPAGQPVFDGVGNKVNDHAGTQSLGTGLGTDTTVQYNPRDWPSAAYRTQPPGDVILFHEMTHGEHQAAGAHDGTPLGNNWTTNEEFNTILQENRYRDQRSQLLRFHHGDM